MESETALALARIAEVRRRPKATLPRGWRTVGLGEATATLLMLLVVIVAIAIGFRAARNGAGWLQGGLTNVLGPNAGGIFK